MTPAETYEKTLEVIREQFHVMESMSVGNRASWYKEVEHLLNEKKTDLQDKIPGPD